MHLGSGKEEEEEPGKGGVERSGLNENVDRCKAWRYSAESAFVLLLSSRISGRIRRTCAETRETAFIIVEMEGEKEGCDVKSGEKKR